MTAIIWIGMIFLPIAAMAQDGWRMNMRPGVTPISHDMYYLHMVAMGVCAVIGVIVFGVMIYALIHHRKSKGHKAANFHENLKLEIIWSVIPFIILVLLAIPATRVLIRMEDTKNADVTIKVVGYQWKWQYQYLDEGISYFSNLATPYDEITNQKEKNPWYLLEVDNPVVIPIHKKIRFLVTGNDVVHSWWVPALGIKRDAIPGFMHEAWANVEKPGIYRGQCAELCGINHGFMPIVVKAVSEDDYNQWVAAQPKVADVYAVESLPPTTPDLSFDELMKKGKFKYEQLCVACHKGDGLGMPPVYPALKGSSVAVGGSISRHILMILNGIPGSAMQPYKDQLTDEDIAAIVTYERNAWDNNTGNIVQAKDVNLARHSEQVTPTMVNKVNAGGLQ